MIRDGARAVISLPYRLLNDGADVLMSTFYRHLLTSTWDISQALAAARSAMFAVRTREAKFGVKVSISDWVVPVLYHNAGTEVELVGDDGEGNHHKIAVNKVKNPKAKSAIAEFLHALGEMPTHHGRSQSTHYLGTRKGSKSEEMEIGEAIPGGEMLGRDGDIFELETRFLMEDNVIRLGGVPGSGRFPAPLLLIIARNMILPWPPITTMG